MLNFDQSVFFGGKVALFSGGRNFLAESAQSFHVEKVASFQLGCGRAIRGQLLHTKEER